MMYPSLGYSNDSARRLEPWFYVGPLAFVPSQPALFPTYRVVELPSNQI